MINGGEEQVRRHATRQEGEGVNEGVSISASAHQHRKRTGRGALKKTARQRVHVTRVVRSDGATGGENMRSFFARHVAGG
jgi:hypothetical protein